MSTKEDLTQIHDKLFKLPDILYNVLDTILEDGLKKVVNEDTAKSIYPLLLNELKILCKKHCDEHLKEWPK